MRKRIIYVIIIVVLLLTGCTIGGSFYMLGFSLRPEETMRAKNATAYEYMYAEYPFLRPWTDSLERAGALRDTVIVDPQGVRLHALYAAAPEPTDRTAVIVHGYTDCAVRMLMIGYLYNHDLRYNILLPDLHYHGRSEGRAIRMGWLDRLDGSRQRAFRRQYADGRPRYLDGCRHDDDGCRRAAAPLCEVFCRGLRLHERLGRVLERAENLVRTSRIPADVHCELAL